MRVSSDWHAAETTLWGRLTAHPFEYPTNGIDQRSCPEVVGTPLQLNTR
ncbi:hypothetical protein [uncultured Thiodictyon sp.]|nr:hypothetical protein [uncultured Thiodictyon sp.]